MFYSHSLLSRNGPLGTIWIAAYCFKKLKRGQITSTNISSTIDKIMPEIHISHRVLAQLLLGIVKIFSKKVDFLLYECNETLHQMRKSLSPAQGIAQYRASGITRKGIGSGKVLAGATPRKGIRSRRVLTFAVDQNKTMKENSTEQEIETMLASYHDVTAILPEQFELDLFDLGVLDEGDFGRSQQRCRPQDECNSGRSCKPSFSIECLADEIVNVGEYTSGCFTPLADVLPSCFMDIDLELSEAHISSNIVGTSKSMEEFHQGGDFEKQSFDVVIQENLMTVQKIEEQKSLTETIDLLKEKSSGMMDVEFVLSETHNSNNFACIEKPPEEFKHTDIGRQAEAVSLHLEVQESHISLNQQTVPSYGDKILPAEEKNNKVEKNHLQGAETITMIDAELEHSKTHKSKFSSTEKPVEELQHAGGFEKQGCLPGSVPLHDVIQKGDTLLYPVHSVAFAGDNIRLFDDQGNLIERHDMRGEIESSVMDVDLEHSGIHNSNNFAGTEKSMKEFHCGGDFEKQACLSGSVSLPEVIQENHVPVGSALTVQFGSDEILPADEQRNLTMTPNFQEEKTSESAKDNSISEKLADALPSDKQILNISGTAFPLFKLGTPAIMESSRVLRKRKKIFDNSLVLSNQVMKQSIHDASGLVCKRRKLPLTKLDIWKFWRCSKFCQRYMDPFNRFSSLESTSMPQKKRLLRQAKKSEDRLVDSASVKDGLLRKSSYSKIETEAPFQKPDIMPKSSKKKLGGMFSLPPNEFAVCGSNLINIDDIIPPTITETKTETEVLIQQSDTSCKTSSNSLSSKTVSLENFSKESTFPDTSDSQLEKELCFHGSDFKEKDIRLNIESGWSPRARAAAKYIWSRFVRFGEQKQDFALSLAQIVEGKTRDTCSRFFYEILALKTYGCIEVRQDIPYGDVSVSVSATTALESYL